MDVYLSEILLVKTDGTISCPRERFEVLPFFSEKREEEAVHLLWMKPPHLMLVREYRSLSLHSLQHELVEQEQSWVFDWLVVSLALLSCVELHSIRKMKISEVMVRREEQVADVKLQQISAPLYLSSQSRVLPAAVPPIPRSA